MARGLARAGARVVLTAARTWDELDAAAAEIAAERGEAAVTTMLADVADPDACEAVVALVLDRFGKLDLLVNNAGRGMKYVSESFMIEPPRFWEIIFETIWQMVIATNVNAPGPDGARAMPHFLRAGRGSVAASVGGTSASIAASSSASSTYAAAPSNLRSKPIVLLLPLFSRGFLRTLRQIPRFQNHRG